MVSTYVVELDQAQRRGSETGISWFLKSFTPVRDRHTILVTSFYTNVLASAVKTVRTTWDNIIIDTYRRGSHGG